MSPCVLNRAVLPVDSHSPRNNKTRISQKHRQRMRCSDLSVIGNVPVVIEIQESRRSVADEQSANTQCRVQMRSVQGVIYRLSSRSAHDVLTLLEQVRPKHILRCEQWQHRVAAVSMNSQSQL